MSKHMSFLLEKRFSSFKRYVMFYTTKDAPHGHPYFIYLSCIFIVHPEGLEPPTVGLKGHCSTIEL